jgi:hypothetical protein
MSQDAVNRAEAQQRVEEYLRRLQQGRRYELVVLADRTREEEFGWIFFYNTKQFAETHDLSWALGGNAPLIIDRVTGELHVTGTALPLEHYIEDYRRRRTAERG